MRIYCDKPSAVIDMTEREIDEQWCAHHGLDMDEHDRALINEEAGL